MLAIAKMEEIKTRSRRIAQAGVSSGNDLRADDLSFSIQPMDDTRFGQILDTNLMGFLLDANFVDCRYDLIGGRVTLRLLAGS